MILQSGPLLARRTLATSRKDDDDDSVCRRRLGVAAKILGEISAVVVHNEAFGGCCCNLQDCAALLTNALARARALHNQRDINPLEWT